MRKDSSRRKRKRRTRIGNSSGCVRNGTHSRDVQYGGESDEENGGLDGGDSSDVRGRFVCPGEEEEGRGDHAQCAGRRHVAGRKSRRWRGGAVEKHQDTPNPLLYHE